MGNIPKSSCLKMSPVCLPSIPGAVLKLCLKRSMKPKFQFLHLENGQAPVWCEALELISLGELSTPQVGEFPREGAVSFLWQVLEPDAPPKYSLSKKACEGILRRAAKRGKELPVMLKEALEAQCVA